MSTRKKKKPKNTKVEKSAKIAKSQIESIPEVKISSIDESFSILSTETETFSADYSKNYVPTMAERSSYVVANTDNSIYDGYPEDGFGKFVQLAQIIPDLDAVDFSKSYNPTLAERSKYVELQLDPSVGWPSTNYPKYAVLTYIVNADALQPLGDNGLLTVPSGINVYTLSGLSLEYTPTFFRTQMLTPSGEGIIISSQVTDTQTSSGCEIYFSATVPTSGYQLTWEAVLL